GRGGGAVARAPGGPGPGREGPGLGPHRVPPAARAGAPPYLTSSRGWRGTANGWGAVNPPMAVVAPQTGTLIRYAQTFDQETDYSLRAIVLVSEGDSASGQDILDGYLSPVGANSIHAAVQRDPTLGGQVAYCAAVWATGYGLMNWNGIDYLAASLILNIGT